MVSARRGDAFGHICLYVSVYPVLAITFEMLDLQTSFWHVDTSPEHLCQVHISRSSGQGQGHINRKGEENVTAHIRGLSL